MMSPKSNKLKQEWDKILEDSGFRDIEVEINGERKLRQYAGSIYSKAEHNRVDVHKRREYFLALSSRCNETLFGKFIDRFVMEQFAEGIKQVDIRRNLLKAGIKRSRISIYWIIRKYLTEWGMRGRVQNSKSKDKG